MKFEQWIHIAAWLLQFGVAYCALSLGQRLKTSRVGWLLFSGLSLFALAHLALPFSPFLSGVESRVGADVLCAATSILLMAGIAHFDNTLKTLLRRPAAEPAPPQPEPQPDTQAMEAAHAAVAEAHQTVARLESELAEANRLKSQLDQNYEESKSQARELIASNEELRLTLTALQAERSEQIRALELAERSHQDQLVSCRQTAMADATAPVMLHLKDVLLRINSLSLTADHLAKSRIAPLVQLTRTISGGARKNGATASPRPENVKTRKSKAPPATVRSPDASALANNLPWMAREISAEQVLLQRKIDFVKRKLESLNENLAIQQIIDKLASSPEAEAPESSLPADSQKPTPEPELPAEQLETPVEPTPELPPDVRASTVLDGVAELIGNAPAAASSEPPEPVPSEAATAESSISV